MSQEQPPIRSRRELRKARDAQQASASATVDQGPAAQNLSGPSPAAQNQAAQNQAAPNQAAPNRPAVNPAPSSRAAGNPAPSSGPAAQAVAGQPSAGKPEQTPAQRSSQIRARDRAALRTIKELEEKEGQLSAGGPPTRRQLRLQQLKEQTLTAANPVVSPASATPGAAPAPASGPQKAAAEPATPGTGPFAAKTTVPAPAASSPAKSGAGERSTPEAKGPDKAAAGSAVPDGMTVEQALAARALIAEQAKNQIRKMEHIASVDPEAVDPEILAEQIALAERAAILNRRAIAKQKLAEQAAGPASQAKDSGIQQKNPASPAKEPAPAKDRPAPSTANNLAMVTPLEFVQVPGIDRPVMKPPATSHVPVTTRPGTKVPPPGTKKRRPAGRSGEAPESGAGRSQVIARAEAVARAAARPKPVVMPQTQSEDLFEDLPRIPASSAHGLEPLDAATAGLARAKRNRVLQFCILVFGILALIAGIILIITGMSR